MTARAVPLIALLLATGCSSGVSELQRCIDHSVREGVSVERAEEGCRAAVGDE